MTKGRRWLIFLAIMSLVEILPMRSDAQVDPRAILWDVIRQLQTGTPNPAWYSPQMWQTIVFQTNNSGIYPQLVALGPAQNINVNRQQLMPTGVLYQMTAQHQNGASNWLLGMNAMPQRIEYAEVQFGSALSPMPSPGPQPNPEPFNNRPGPPPVNPAPGISTTPATQTSEACRRFPNMC